MITLLKMKPFIDSFSNKMTEIFDWLYLGGKRDIFPLCISSNIDIVINVARELYTFEYPDGIVVYRLSLRDHIDENIYVHFASMYLYLEIARLKGYKVLIHCRAGISRSASFVLYYLMRKNRWSLTRALLFVQSKRPQVSPNQGFLRQLLSVENE